jgi:hypothetical protein
MRRHWPKMLIFAIITFSLAIMAAPANAAPKGPAASANVESQPYLGMVCRTVHSNVHHKTGVICVGISAGNNRAHPAVRAVVFFKSDSGKLIAVSARHLVLYQNGIKVAHGLYSSAPGNGGFVVTTKPRNLWDGGIFEFRSAVFGACMYWTGGAHACTGASWLYSKKIWV